MRQLPFILFAFALVFSHSSIASTQQLIEQGEEAWARRAAGHEGSRAQPEPIEEAIQSFSQALEQEPGNRSARWLLLRALYFKGEYVIESDVDKLALFQAAIEIADSGRAQLLATTDLVGDPDEHEASMIAQALEGEDQAAEIYFWSAAHWGLWGQYRGKIAAARQGVAKRVRDYAEVTAILDEQIEEAGGHRILGRLHTEAPRLPFVTPWVDHDEAVSRLERAAEIDPDALLTKLFLAEALLEFRPEQRSEALSLLESVTASTPDPQMVVEETKTIEDARAVLETLR